MKRTAMRKTLTPFLFLLSAVLQGAFAAQLGGHIFTESDAGTTTLRHVYVAGSDPKGRATIGKALTRLGYVPSENSDAGADPHSLTLNEVNEANREGYSYTEISMPHNNTDGLSTVLSTNANYIIAQRGSTQTSLEHQLSLMGSADDAENQTLSWRRMAGPPDLGGKLLELSIVRGETLGIQAEKWVALCDFLGLGYSAVERLRLRQFP